MIHPHHNPQNDTRGLLVTVPEGAKNFFLGTSYAALCWNNYEGTIRLPSGSYDIFCKASEATEEQAKELIEQSPKRTAWRDYGYRGEGFCFNKTFTAKDSLLSLLQSLGMEANTTLILKQK